MSVIGALLLLSISSTTRWGESIASALPSNSRLIDSVKIWERGAALTSRLQLFETEVLARGEDQAKPINETAKRAALATSLWPW